ncbi:MAG TPA: DUF4296 domain-containing protein [Flavobacteriales bacterium]|nr:DUF4296 domain-containing protein [Flavobacteriales bacterium]HRO40919.1 DUF4296 domain-containing protein [Flavobacteriales bacterium]HRP82886.1 DUF4296 domain-containing protein [Flavobacteriales bacterium]HRQ85568.1 DUF4296 domain-containing protein [Flavobacteriales bacterium]
MRKLAAALPLLLLLAACGSGEKPPKAPLARAKFERVLAGSLLIEARLGQEIQIEKRADSPAATYYQELFEQEGVTEADFKATYEAYLQQPELLKEVYQDVLNQLQQRADSLTH